MKLKPTLAAFAIAIAVAVPAGAQQTATLYKRVGGYDPLAAVTDDFLARLVPPIRNSPSSSSGMGPTRSSAYASSSSTSCARQPADPAFISAVT
jgi:hypothetical protein